MRLHFSVTGAAQTKGSTRSFGYYAKNKQTRELLLNKHGKPILLTATTNDNPKTKGWAQAITEAANRAIEELPAAERGWIADGVRVTVAFYLPRPGKFAKRALTPAHLTAPDLDKLVRAVLDALTKVAWQDDSHVVDLVAMKRYTGIADAPHAEIWIEACQGGAPVLARAQDLFELGTR